MLKIGDFSRLGQVTIRTLHHYEQMGLLKARRVDQETGYRYYDLEQLPRLHRILAFKDLGFSLEQIADLLTSDPSAEMMQGMLMARRVELEREMDATAARMERVAARLRQIEMGDDPNELEIVVKSVPAVTVASLRSIVPTVDMVGYTCDTHFRELSAWLRANRLPEDGLTMNLYYNEEYTETDLDQESAVLLDAPPRQPVSATNAEIRVYDLDPVEHMASLVHPLSFAGLPDGVTSLLRWMTLTGYRLAGPLRVLHLFGHPRTVRTDETVVMEIQLPIERATTSEG
jgi:DNA-binding transcriptional MerR regulator